ncbi:MAG TPA: hypothetical protein VFE44_03305 [Thermoanaerobaculia bacterium]|nr:hypothetical protein [Thermoanaerobaculia bacterium]
MSCGEWVRLRPWVAARLERGAAPAPESAAPGHLAECDECRRLAYALDPSLVFLKLREPGTGRESSDAAGHREMAEIAAMRERVAMMRSMRSMRSMRAMNMKWPGAARRGARALGWRWAAAALLVGAGLAQGDRPAAVAPVPLALAAGPAATMPTELELQPVVEELGRPEARVYQFAGDDLSVVMIVDETLDV